MEGKILIIDHEKDNRTILESILKKEGYQVTSVADGERAMDLVKSEPFDVIIMDLRSPGIHKPEAIRQIKETDDSLEVIVLTGYVTIENAVKSLRDDGAFDFLAKPLENKDQLISIVKKALQRHAVKKEKRDLHTRLKKTLAELNGILNKWEES